MGEHGEGRPVVFRNRSYWVFGWAALAFISWSAESQPGDDVGQQYGRPAGCPGNRPSTVRRQYPGPVAYMALQMVRPPGRVSSKPAALNYGGQRGKCYAAEVAGRIPENPDVRSGSGVGRKIAMEYEANTAPELHFRQCISRYRHASNVVVCHRWSSCPELGGWHQLAGGQCRQLCIRGCPTPA